MDESQLGDGSAPAETRTEGNQAAGGEAVQGQVERLKKAVGWLLTGLVLFLVAYFVVAYLVHAPERRSQRAVTEPPVVGKPAPDFDFPLLGGGSAKLSDFRGQVVFVNIWSTWCPTCVWEMPSMERLYQAYKDQGLTMLAVSIDILGEQVVQPFTQKYGLHFPVLLDPEGLSKRLYATTGVPETFIIDQSGILVEKVIGPREWDTPSMRAYFEALLERGAEGVQLEIVNPLVELGGHLHALTVLSSTHILVGAHKGLFESRDRGGSWNPVGAGTPVEGQDVMVVQVDPRDARRIWVAGHDIGVMATEDGGATWGERNGGLASRDVHALLADRMRPERALLWLVGEGFFRTEDGGRSWHQVAETGEEVQVHALVALEGPAPELLAGTDAGLLISRDDGKSWSRLRTNLAGPVIALASEPRISGHLLAATRDGLWSSPDRGKTWVSRSGSMEDDSPVAIMGDPTGGAGFLVLTEKGNFFNPSF